VVSTWSLAAVLGVIASVQAHTVVEALVPAGVVLTLAIAPLALIRGHGGAFDLLATIVCSVVLGALAVAASTTLGAQGMLAWATVVGGAAIAIAPSLPRRWTTPACIAGGLFGASGLAYGTSAAVTAIFGPLAWLRDAWTGSLAISARSVFAGPRTTTAWRFGWPSVAALTAGTAAVTAVAAPIGRRRALVSTALVLGAAATLAALASCVAPVVAGASVGAACATAIGVLSALLVGAAVLDRSRPGFAFALLPVAILPAIATTGWAAATPTSSIVVLASGCVVGAFATAVAASNRMRVVLGAFSAATAITLAGVATAASGRHPATAGFAIAVAAGFAILGGVHGRWRAPEGAALEVVGTVGFVVGASIAAQQLPWLATTFTMIVPMLLVAALRRERSAYSVAGGAAAVAATWAWLAASHVTIVEAYSAPAAVIALAVGLLEWRRGPARSWLALGPAIVLGLGPTLGLGIAHDDTVRTVTVAVIAFAVVAFGAWKQLQAPLALGSVALLAVAGDTFGPDLARLPRWLPLAVVGLLLMWIGATFETRRDRAKKATLTLLHFG
jgi:hypothetical protein